MTGTGLEASPSGTPQLSSQPSQHQLPGAPGLVGMASPALQQHLQPAAPQYGLPPRPISGLPGPSQLANHGYNLLSSPAQAQVRYRCKCISVIVDLLHISLFTPSILMF